jgi:hypothetical protein
MNNYDYGLLFVLLIILLLYLYIVKQNKDLIYNKSKIDSFFNKKQSIILEIVILIILLTVIVILYNQKHYILLITFIAVFIEHIKQILFCYRQTLKTLHIITLFIYLIFGIYSYFIKCYWIIYIFFIGSIFHIIPLLYNKQDLDIVCIKDISSFFENKI